MLLKIKKDKLTIFKFELSSSIDILRTKLQEETSFYILFDKLENNKFYPSLGKEELEKLLKSISSIEKNSYINKDIFMTEKDGFIIDRLYLFHDNNVETFLLRNKKSFHDKFFVSKADYGMMKNDKYEDKMIK